MDAIIDIAAVTTAAAALVNLLKFAYPAAPSWALAIVAIAAGIGLSLLAIVARGDALASQAIAQAIFAGIVAAVTAAGLDRQAITAAAKRQAARLEAGAVERPRP